MVCTKRCAAQAAGKCLVQFSTTNKYSGFSQSQLCPHIRAQMCTVDRLQSRQRAWHGAAISGSMVQSLATETAVQASQSFQRIIVYA